MLKLSERFLISHEIRFPPNLLSVQKFPYHCSPDMTRRLILHIPDFHPRDVWILPPQMQTCGPYFLDHQSQQNTWYIASGGKTKTHTRPVMSPGTDPSATALAIHSAEPAFFHKQNIRIPKPKPRPNRTSRPGKMRPPRTLGKGQWGQWAPTCAAPRPPPLPTFPAPFSSLKTSNFALGMSRMKCHLPIKRERRESHALHSIHILWNQGRPLTLKWQQWVNTVFSSHLPIVKETWNFARCPSPGPSLPSSCNHFLSFCL